MKLAEIYQQCKIQNDFPKGFDKMFAIIKKPFRTITKKEYAELKLIIVEWSLVQYLHLLKPLSHP